MDQNRIEGAANEFGGKLKDAMGGVVGDTKTQAEGKADQASGQIQNAYGQVKDSAREAADTLGTQIDSFVKDKPALTLLAAVGLGFMLGRTTYSR